MARKPIATGQSGKLLLSPEDLAHFHNFMLSVGSKLGLKDLPPTAPKPVTADDLPDAAQAILGLVCQSGDCLHDQPLCPPDPRITCQLIPTDPSLTTWVRDWVLLPWRIANAQKGDLIMSPGSGGGVIGGLLSQLKPPQHYTHMGIMTQDQVEIRHATISQDWLMDHPNGYVPFDGPEPTDGFEADALRYGWPGTITQSIDTAYGATLDDHYPGAEVVAADNNKSYTIKELSFESTAVNVAADSDPPQWTIIDCLVVSPCPESVEAREALHNIAEEVKAIRGHYRFYAYTDASISQNPDYFGPPRLEAQQPNPDDPCAPLIDVKRTVPVVCSTLIWTAIQNLNARGALPQLVINTADESDPNACPNTFERRPQDDNPDGVYDGLFFYDEKQRAEAAEKLYEYLHKMVEDIVASKIPGIAEVLGGVAIGLNFAIALMGQPIGIIAEVLGISVLEAQTLLDWVTDLPDDVANQFINAFAFDWCDTEAKDSDKWKKPSTGRSVSPDNIIRSWSNQLSHSPKRMLGLYGQNRRAIVRPPQWQIRPLQAWTFSEGDAGMQGIVAFQGKPINGATVKVCCAQTLSAHDELFVRVLHMEQDGIYKMAAPAGNYLAVAGYEDPDTGLWLSDEKPVILPFNQVARVDFDLQAPPTSNREITCIGKMDIVSRVAFGHDWWAHPQFIMRRARVGPYGKPGSPDADIGKVDHISTSQQLSDYGSVQINIDVFWLANDTGAPNSVSINWIAAIFDGKDQKVSDSRNDQVIAPGDTRGWIVDMATATPWPDRAHIEFSVTNGQQP